MNLYDRQLKALKKTRFSEDLQLFQDIKELVPGEWDDVFNNISINVYLNQNDSKEFEIEQNV